MIGLAANTAIAQNISLYLRYDGEIGTGTDSHAPSAYYSVTVRQAEKSDYEAISGREKMTWTTSRRMTFPT